MSAEQLITDHLDLWTSAVTYKSGRGAGKGRELTGIKKLRELILELAVRGKLVEQDPNDEPASLLLERIAEERARLVQEGKVRKSQGSTNKAAIENSFDTNKGWIKTTLSNVGYWAIGNGFPKQEQGQAEEEVLFCKVSDMNLTDNHKEILSTTSTVSHETAKRLKLNLHPAGTIVFPKIGGAISTNKRRRVVKPTAIDNNCLGVIPSCGISSDYLFLFLTSVDMAEYQAGTSVPALSQNVLGKIVIRLPPLEEQHRIVAKVDELMALCDRLGQQTGDQLDAHEVLVDTLLDALTRAENAEEVAAQWARLAEHFDTLFTTEASIDKLKQAILQLAVMGRLVEQDPNDEPASVLVNAIIDERNRLKDQEGMRTKASDNIDEDELYFSAPTHWNWIKLGNAAKFIDYRGRTPNKTKSGRRLITAKNIRQGYIDLCPEEFISDEDYLSWMTRGFPRVGDTLFTTEAPLGNVANIDIQEEFALAQRAICFQWHLECISEFMLLQLMASAFQKQLEENSNGMTATGIKSAKLKEIPVVLPPISEQHRIVTRVDELMALCDQLKVCLNNANETRMHLAKSVVAQEI